MLLSYKQGRGKKLHIYIDDEYMISTDIDFWADNYIKNETEISEQEWEELVDKINYRKALNKAFDLLSRRDHSVKELKIKLLKTVEENSAQKAIERMLELDYLDDEKYAENLLRHLTVNKKMSSSFIKKEMFKRGISGEIVNNLLEDTEIDNVSTIKDLILTKYVSKLSAENGKEKVIAALQRKGFGYYDIRKAFDEIEYDYE